MVLGTTIISSVASFFGVGYIAGILYGYTSPLVIMGALALLLCFNGLHIQSRFVNWLAASSFAIYLFHCNANLCEPYYRVYAQRIYATYSGLEYLAVILCFIISVAVMAVVIDQLRKVLWKRWVLPIVLRFSGEEVKKAD